MRNVRFRKPTALRNHYVNICLAISINQGHRSKIVALRVVTYYNSGSRENEELPEEVSMQALKIIFNS